MQQTQQPTFLNITVVVVIVKFLNKEHGALLQLLIFLFFFFRNKIDLTFFSIHKRKINKTITHDYNIHSLKLKYIFANVWVALLLFYI